MKRATEVVRAGRWPPGERIDSVTLLFDDRYRRRLRMLGDGGIDFLLDLIEPIVLHAGDGLSSKKGGRRVSRPRKRNWSKCAAAMPPRSQGSPGTRQSPPAGRRSRVSAS
jgi:hypothetical protein